VDHVWIPHEISPWTEEIRNTKESEGRGNVKMEEIVPNLKHCIYSQFKDCNHLVLVSSPPLWHTAEKKGIAKLKKYLPNFV
jgi:hypothetical protein